MLSFTNRLRVTDDVDDPDDGGIVIGAPPPAPSAPTTFSLSGDGKDSKGDRYIAPHRVFVEMEELMGNKWRETARWVRFEEDVDTEGNRWSKPHVATLQLHSLFQLKQRIDKDPVLLYFKSGEYPDVIGRIVQELRDEHKLNETEVIEIRDSLLKRHTHQFEHTKHSRQWDPDMPERPSFVAGVKHSASHLFHHHSASNGALHHGASEVSVNPGAQSTDSFQGHDVDYKGDSHFLQKVPKDAETCNVLVGEIYGLQETITIFVRFDEAVRMGDLTEIPVPTRFMFMVFGPKGSQKQNKEIGRAMSTMMSDEIFAAGAYKARKREHLVEDLQWFLEEVTVLPPGEWDPNIRIEPPSKVPTTESRVSMAQGEALAEEEEDEHGSGDALKRTGKLFGGLWKDIKRKAPWYPSDFYNAIRFQCVASFFFIFFAILAPVITFGGLLEEATDGNLAAIEGLLSAAVCGCLYHLFSGQPLTIIGPTGPMLVFEAIIFNMSTDLGLYYMSLRFWVGIFTAILLLIIVATDASSLVTFITRFTEESFSCLISLIFIVEAFKKLFQTLKNYERVAIYDVLPGATCRCEDGGKKPVDTIVKAIKGRLKHHPYEHHNFTWFTNNTIHWDNIPLDDCKHVGGKLVGTRCHEFQEVFFMSLVLMMGTFVIAFTLKAMRNSRYLPVKLRTVLSDFAVIIGIIIMSAVGFAAHIYTPSLNVPTEFRPTRHDRGWVIPPFNGNPWWTVLLAIPPALLACILIFMDQQITAVIVNRRENKLRKGCGYHLDLFVLAIIIILCSILGLPFYVAATVLSITHVQSLKVESECTAPGEVPQFSGVIEQRVTGFLVFLCIGLSVLIPQVLRLIPMPVLYGVFLYMGVSSLRGVQLVDRILLFFTPMAFQPDTIYVRHVPISRIHLYTIIQVICLAVLWTVKSIKKISIIFPIMLIVIIGVRKLIERIFTEHDLKYLDDKMPDFHLRNKEDKQKEKHIGSSSALATSKSDKHLHIPLASGHVMKIPLHMPHFHHSRHSKVSFGDKPEKQN